MSQPEIKHVIGFIFEPMSRARSGGSVNGGPVLASCLLVEALTPSIYYKMIGQLLTRALPYMICAFGRASQLKEPGQQPGGARGAWRALALCSGVVLVVGRGFWVSAGNRLASSCCPYMFRWWT